MTDMIDMYNTHEKVLELIEIALYKNDLEFMNLLGCLYHEGSKLIKQDGKKAEYWWKMAAEQGYYSTGNLGLLYYEGSNNIEKDYVKSIYWYKKRLDDDDVTNESIYYINVKIEEMIAELKENNQYDKLIEALKIYNPDEYQLEIRSYNKMKENDNTL